MVEKQSRINRKPITFNKIILQIIDEEIHRRGGQTSYSAIINEILAEKYSEEIQVRELKANQTKS